MNPPSAPAGRPSRAFWALRRDGEGQYPAASTAPAITTGKEINVTSTRRSAHRGARGRRTTTGGAGGGGGGGERTVGAWGAWGYGVGGAAPDPHGQEADEGGGENVERGLRAHEAAATPVARRRKVGKGRATRGPLSQPPRR